MNRNSPNRRSPFAKKSLGQNFLADETYVRKIVSAAALGKSDTVIEIGPGRGALTKQLIERAGRVIAIELDPDLARLLANEFGKHNNFDIIEADILNLDISDLAGSRKLKIVANLPYYISTAVLQHLIEQRLSISDMVLMFQREVVNRIVAQPGNSDRGYLTVLVEAFLNVEKLFDVPPTAFRPAPKVWSSVVRIAPRGDDRSIAERGSEFERLVSAGFRQKRKTILNNLKAASAELKIEDPTGVIALAGIDPTRRAESLTLEEWKRLLINYTASSDV